MTNLFVGAKECIAIEGYRSGALTTKQVRRMLGLGTRMQVDALLKQAGVYLEYTDEEFAQDIETNSSVSPAFRHLKFWIDWNRHTGGVNNESLATN